MAPRESFGSSVSNLKARLRENPCGAFAFFGPEELLKQFYLQKFVTLIEKEGSPEFNLVRLDFTRDHTMSNLYDEAQILPFGGEKRLVVCRGLNPAKLSAGDLRQFLEVLDSFPPFLTLIVYLESEEFTADRDTLGKESVKALVGKLDFVSFPLQQERVLLPWSQKILAADGLSTSDRAMRTLFRLCGNRMQIIRGELEKLASHALYRNQKAVTEEDVLLFAQDTTEFALYNLSDAVLEGALGAVEKILSSLKKQEVEPVAVSATLSKTLTNALLIAEGADAKACSTVTGLFPWQFEKYQRSLFGKKKENLEKAMLCCLDLDRKLKGDRSDGFLVMEVAVMQMTRILGGGK